MKAARRVAEELFGNLGMDATLGDVRIIARIIDEEMSPPDEALGADEVAREAGRRAAAKIANVLNIQHPEIDWPFQTITIVVADEIAPAIREAEQRTRVEVLNEAIALVENLRIDPAFSGHWQNGFQMAKSKAVAAFRSDLKINPVKERL
jgi:hypothetical protein